MTTPVDTRQNQLAIIRKIRAGEALNGIGPGDCGEKTVIFSEAVRTYEETGRDPGPALRVICTDPELLRLASEDSEPAELEPEPDVPPLPVGIDSFESSTGWLNQYQIYAMQISPMTPVDFHQSAGLWLASVAIARRLKVSLSFGDIYPNLFILWVASTTLHRKTTAFDIARRIARRVMPHLLTVQDATPEALLSDLAGREPTHFEMLAESDKELWQKSRDFAAQKGLTLDELSSLIATSNKDYGSGLLETLIRLYDCDERYARSTRAAGLTIIKNAYLSLMGASTPIALAPFLNNNKMWSMGFWPRFALLTPEGRPDWKEPADNPVEPLELASRLQQLMDRLPVSVWPEPPGALTVELAGGVYHHWQRYNKAISYDLLTDDLDERLHGTYGRMPTQVIKIATILAALDWRNEPAPVIQNYHLGQAIAICEKWRASAHRVLSVVTKTEFNVLQERIVKQVSRAGQAGATMREIYRLMKDRSPVEIEDGLNQLIKVGMIEDLQQSPGQKGGRPTVRYRLV